MSSFEIIDPSQPTPPSFVHLHLHTTYSLLDGAQRVGDVGNPKKEFGVLNQAKKLGMDAVAITDHGNMFGAVDFYKKARKADIKPIIGCEVYMAPQHRENKEAKSMDGKRAFHFVLLAQNYVGYQNLCKMVTRGFFEGFYYNPRIDKELLREYSEGIIGLSGCLASEVSQHAMRGRFDEAREVAKEFNEILDGRFFMELQMNGIDEQLTINPHLVDIANSLNIPLVATNDVHYMTREDAAAQDVLMAIQMRKQVDDPTRLKHEVTEFYLKSPEQMYKEFAAYPTACANTVDIAKMCNVELPLDKSFFPVIAAPDPKMDNKTYLLEESLQGLDQRWEMIKETKPAEELEALRKVYEERLKYELMIIDDMGFNDYFLIVSDFIVWAKNQGIPVGPGRGCLIGETPVIMADGQPKALQEICVGDEVFSHTGEPRRVLDTMAYDIDESLLCIKTYRGDSVGITMTQDHKVFAEKAVITERYKKLAPKWKSKARKFEAPLGEFEEIPAEALVPGDWVYYPKLQANVDMEVGHQIDLHPYIALNYCDTDFEDGQLLETVARNHPFKASVRDIRREAGASRGFIKKYLREELDEKSLTVRQKAAKVKVDGYLQTLDLTPGCWREEYESNRLYAISRWLTLDTELMWMLGKWVADGWFNHTKRREVGFCFHSNETQERARLERWLLANHLSYTLAPHPTKQLVQLYVNSETFHNWMRSQFPSYEQHSTTKTLPLFVHRISDELLVPLLQGYISGDGYVTSSRIKMSTVSAQLARQLKYALHRLNIPCSIRKEERVDPRKAFSNTSTSYVVACPALQPIVAKGSETQANYRYHQFEHGIMCQIKSIEEVSGVNKVFDITVEHDHSYMTYNGAVHNSAAGSLVAYVTSITDVDPIEHDLLFERFLNPERVSMPDIDVDFCEHRREDVIEYVRQKYAVEGGYAVSQIITFGTLQAKAAVRDVGRAYGMSYGDADRISKLIPNVLGIKLEEAIQQEPRLAQLIKQDPAVAKVIDISQRLEGLNRHASIHAAGVVISDGRPLDNHMPLYKGANGEVVSQYDMNCVESIGLIKFDFLGLKNLTLIQHCIELIKQNHNVDVDIARIPFDDPETFKLLCRGDTLGVFQLESSGMREVMMKLKPSVFADVVALVALYRPGPLQGGVVDSFIDRKHGREAIKYIFNELEPILNQTYGVCIYQEQVMQIANVVANYSLGEADMLRRAMGKKKADEMARQRLRFLQGAAENKFDEKKAEELFDTLEQFAKYGFNKSHSAAYGLIAYQTGWLKANYRHEYMAALLSAVSGNSDKVLLYLNDCRNSNIEVLPPHVNESQKQFAVVNKKIRFGLSAVKGIGDAPIEGIIETRTGDEPFESFIDFCERIDFKGRKINKKVLEALIKCGAFDGLGPTRSTMFHDLERTVAHGVRVQEEKASAQFSLFGGEMADAAPAYKLNLMAEWGEKERLSLEKGVLGLYISGHPLDRYHADLDRFVSANISELIDKPTGSTATIVGIVTSRKDMTTKRGDRMAFLMVEDLTGEVEVNLFPKVFQQAAPYMEQDIPLLLKGDIEKGEKSVKFTAQEVHSLAEIRSQRAKEIHVELLADTLTEKQVDEMSSIFQQHKGRCVTFLHFKMPGHSKSVWRLPEDFKLEPAEELVESLERLFGKNPTSFK